MISTIFASSVEFKQTAFPSIYTIISLLMKTASNRTVGEELYEACINFLYGLHLCEGEQLHNLFTAHFKQKLQFKLLSFFKNLIKHECMVTVK